MGKPLIFLLLAFWGYLAYGALQRGDTTTAIVFVVVGIAITAYRLKRSPSA
jgi:hypothetical protein